MLDIFHIFLGAGFISGQQSTSFLQAPVPHVVEGAGPEEGAGEEETTDWLLTLHRDVVDDGQAGSQDWQDHDQDCQEQGRKASYQGTMVSQGKAWQNRSGLVPWRKARTRLQKAFSERQSFFKFVEIIQEYLNSNRGYTKANFRRKVFF